MARRERPDACSYPHCRQLPAMTLGFLPVRGGSVRICDAHWEEYCEITTRDPHTLDDFISEWRDQLEFNIKLGHRSSERKLEALNTDPVGWAKREHNMDEERMAADNVRYAELERQAELEEAEIEERRARSEAQREAVRVKQKAAADDRRLRRKLAQLDEPTATDATPEEPLDIDFDDFDI